MKSCFTVFLLAGITAGVLFSGCKDPQEKASEKIDGVR